MHTIIETPTFQEDSRKIWSDEERGAFCAWLAANPKVGDVIPGSGGCRKVRRSIAGLLLGRANGAVQELSTSIALQKEKYGF